MKRGTRLKRGQITIFCLLTALLVVNPTYQENSKTQSEFELRTEPKLPKEPTQGVNSISQREQQQITKKRLIGELSTMWSPKDSKMVVSIAYSPQEGQSSEFTKRLTVSFPFKNNPTYVQKTLTYSTEKAPPFRISKQDISQEEITQPQNQQPHSDPGDNTLSLLNLTTWISMKAEEDDKTDNKNSPEPTFPNIKELKFSFDDANSTHHFELKHRSTLLQNIKHYSIICFCILVITISPLLSFYFLGRFEKVFMNTHLDQSRFIGFTLSRPTYLLSTFSLFRLVDSIFSFFVVILVILIAGSVIFSRVLRFFECSKIIIRQFKRFRLYTILVVVLNIAWLVAVILDENIFLTIFFFFCFSICIDLMFIDKDTSMRRRTACDVWSLVMPLGLPFQMLIYAAYYQYYWRVNKEDPRVFQRFILPDLVLMALMVIPFHLRFRRPKIGSWNPQMAKESKIFPKPSKIKPIFCFRANLSDLQLPAEFNPHHHKMMKHVPVCKRMVFRTQIGEKGRFIFEDFNLNSKNPFFTKDFIKKHTVDSVECLSYFRGEKSQRAWVFGLSQNVLGTAEKKKSIILEEIWMDNQQRRDLVGILESGSNKVRIFSLSTRRVILEPSFRGIEGWLSEKMIVSSNTKIVILGRTPLLLYKNLWVDSLSIYVAQGWAKGSKSKLKNIEDRTFFDCVTDIRDRSSLTIQSERVFYENLIASKNIWVDRKFLNRKQKSECKFQLIWITEININKQTVTNIKCLDQITEGMFSSYKIDSFFFTDRETLALVIDSKIFLVAWRKSEVLRCIEIASLYNPLLDAGYDMKNVFLKFWHDRKRGMVRFSVGFYADRVSLRKDSAIEYSNTTYERDVMYLYSGWFSDQELLGGDRKKYFLKKNLGQENGDLKVRQKEELEEIKISQKGQLGGERRSGHVFEEL